MFRYLTAGFVLCLPHVVLADDVDYVRDIRPLLKEKCYACHSALKQNSGLRADTAAALIRGGDSGATVVPGKPKESLLIGVLTGDAGFQMPPENEGSPLSQEEIQLVVRWIEQGAQAPKNEEPQTDPRDWWSYRPIERPEAPETSLDWGRSQIDRFIGARLQAHNLTPHQEAGREVWLRRVYLDLIGLPPSRRELRAFLADDSATAYENVVDDLLSRPQYGERWGRHWMDIWRYSEWYGRRGNNEIRYSQRHIWRWRDWIVDSLNADKGYDRMIIEMLAGDEVAADDTSILPATGYLGRSWYKFDRNVWLFETVERTGEAFLGLTLRCCRCHDHKYDPVSQEEYYQLRAFFEPHNVRTDPVSAATKTETDNGKSQVLTAGLSRVYDKDPDAPTYRFIRGDGRYPDESKVLKPGVPSALGGNVKIAPIDLPPGGFYPAMRPEFIESLIAAAKTKIDTATDKQREAEQKVAESRLAVTKREAAGETKESDPSVADVFLQDDFSKAAPDIWQLQGGDWVYENGHLVEKAVTSFATMVTKQDHPSDFRVRVKYRPLQPGGYRSIGFSFDFKDKGNSQDVYTSTGNAKQSVQAFHRVGGKQVYPREGIVPVSLKVGEVATIEAVVRGSQLTIDLNGERKLDYVMPIKRQPGKFALWVHNGSAEFHELTITGVTESLDDLQRKVRDAEHELRLASLEVRAAEAEFESVQARAAAEKAAYFGPDDEQRKNLASAASSAERRVQLVAAEKAVVEVSHRLEEMRQTREPGVEKPKAELDLETKLADAEKKQATAAAAVKTPDGKYEPLGDVFPKTSTGRRLALARWIASESNPRTARVAANHIWNRHFGRPLVDTTENFGLNGRQPTHPQLLDWLSAELISNGWQMKPLHRQIVLSNVYRQSSRDTDEDNRRADPENRFLWRMNSKRMEAEVVRDSVLSLSGRIDLTRGGPDLAESNGERVPRRSIYFRNTPDSRMPMLELFDMANPNACYRRRESVIPQQALALMNSGLAQDQARDIAENVSKDISGADDSEFVAAAFETMLSRQPNPDESEACVNYLGRVAKASPGGSKFPGGGSGQRTPAAEPTARARENLIHVLLLHNDFVTIR